MKARTVARELALLTLFQVEKSGSAKPINRASLEDLIVGTVRTLSTLAEEQIRHVFEELATLKSYLIDYEILHPDNEDIPLEAPTEPVPIPTTRDMAVKLESLLGAVENLEEALYLPEVSALSEREDVQNYCYMLVRLVQENQAGIDGKIDAAATDWRVDRLQKMDRVLLRLAIAELSYAKDVETAAVIDESLELTRRFASEESRKFIHGILGHLYPAEVTDETPESSSEPSAAGVSDDV